MVHKNLTSWNVTHWSYSKSLETQHYHDPSASPLCRTISVTTAESMRRQRWSNMAQELRFKIQHQPKILPIPANKLHKLLTNPSTLLEYSNQSFIIAIACLFVSAAWRLRAITHTRKPFTMQHRRHILEIVQILNLALLQAKSGQSLSPPSNEPFNATHASTLKIHWK